jgi:hypothetical protein
MQKDDTSSRLLASSSACEWPSASAVAGGLICTVETRFSALDGITSPGLVLGKVLMIHMS